MRQAYAHEALLDIGGAADSRAPGAAVTSALCGSWEHDGPCPLAPHHTQATRDGARLRVRVLFAVEPESEPEVRRRIEDALSSGRLEPPAGDSPGGEPPAGELTVWRLARSWASRPTAAEREQAARLVASP